MTKTRNLLLATAMVVACAAAAPAQAQTTQRYDIAAQDLRPALRQFSTLSGREVVAASTIIANKRSTRVRGDLAPAQALAAMLARTGLRAELVDGAFVIRPADQDTSAEAVPDDIVITGSRIRGAPVASPVIRLGNDDIRNAGQATLAEAIRTIPQNFGGGQNPGVGFNVPATSGVNVGSSTALNLRGLGSDATLTLLNGHRLSYSASRQAIDISSIPLGAVDRIEIVPDGASALYGSDAVAGVANIVLKSDYNGLATSARIGTSTDGGDFEQRYGAVAGAKWSGGGFITAYEFGRTTAIEGRERAYTASRSAAMTLFPGIRQHSILLSGHQDLGGGIRFELDALYNNRFSETAYSLDPGGNILLSGNRAAYTSRSFAAAPTLRVDLGGDWRGFLTGSYGQDHTRYDITIYAGGTAYNFPGNCYCNNSHNLEAGADGTLFRLPGGPVKLAVGAGYRDNTLIRFNGAGATTNISKTQDSYYGYGEISVPLVSPDQNVAFVERLSLSGALRYEKYPGIGEVATPKIGLIYAPTPDVDVKVSWGKSFRAPTLYQQYQARNVVLATPATFGGTGYAATATAVFLQGGNPDLKPERATTWTATLDIHPRGLPGASLELSYFSTHYRDRVVTPIAFASQSLSNPLYANRLIANPSASFLSSIIASAISFGNATSSPYDPAKVAVFIDDSNVNAGRQSIRGADMLFGYTSRLGDDGGTLGATLNATYLTSDQQLKPGAPVTQLAGILFNPPHFRARGGLSWARSGLTLTGDVSYVGGVRDTRTATVIRVGSMTTFDLSARYTTGDGKGAFRNLDIVLSLQNAFNAKPAPIATTLLYDAPYDSTNQSPVGRFVSVSITKKW